MPLGLSDLLRIKQELGFYGAGGGRRTDAEQFGQGMTAAGQGLSNAGQGIGQGLDTYNNALKNFFANQQTKSQQAPISDYLPNAENYGLNSNTPTNIAPAVSGIAMGPINRALKNAIIEKTFGQTGEINQKLKEQKDWVYQDNKTGTISDQPQEGYMYRNRKDANSYLSQLNLTKQKASTSGQIPDEQVDATIGLVKNGKIAISQLPGFGATSLKGRVIAKLATADPSFSFMKNETDFEAVKKYTQYINSPAYQNTIKYLESVQPNLDEVVKLSDILDKSQYPIINKVQLEAMKQSGDVNTAKFATATTEVADQIAKILQGGGTGNATSDAKLNQAQKILDGNFSPEQFKGIASELKTLLANRQSALESDTVKTIGQNSTTKKPSHTNNQSSQLPKEAETKVMNALGAPVTFGNGQTWHWDGKKSVRDK